MTHNHALFVLSALALLLFAPGCAQQAPPTPGPLVGNDSDSHGCIGTAGYTWCAAKAKCLREWEENCTAEVPIPALTSGNELHGCNISGGYEWCMEKQRCILPSQEKCTELSGTDNSDHGCGATAGYVWCEGLSKCILPSVENCTAPAASPFVAIVQENCGKPNVASVSICGNYVKVASSLDGGGAIFYMPGNSTPTRCPLVSPGSESAQCKELSGACGTEQKVC